MKKFNHKIFRLTIVGASVLYLFTTGCTNLDEQLYGAKFVDTSSTASTADLESVYAQMNGFADQSNLYALEEHTTDEMMGPTRGTDWDDFGVWRKLHQHTWDPSHTQIFDTWNQLNTGVYRATVVITKATDNQIKAEASFLRAFYMFYVVDLYGQAPFRDPADSPDANPKVFNRKDATDFIIKDLEFAAANLASGTPGKATKEAAEFLLAKVYLNKAVYDQDPANPAGPYNFAKEDMDNVIKYCNLVMSSGKYSLAGSYFDNFKWDNSTASRELIFVRENTDQAQPANARNRTYMVHHYNQTPSGWNGFTTLAAFYDSFEDGDQRKGMDIPDFTQKTGDRAGFLVGQAYGPNHTPLKDRSGQPLIFTPEVNINYATEAQGIRVIKYPLNPNKIKSNGDIETSENDYVFFRYSDLLLMKAEAIQRGGTDPQGQTALGIVNELRKTRSASALGALDDAALLAERGRELYWEGWRRNDLVRFGKFNDPVDQRSQKSDGTKVVFPIPQRAVDTNPNLHQNPGY